MGNGRGVSVIPGKYRCIRKVMSSCDTSCSENLSGTVSKLGAGATLFQAANKGALVQTPRLSLA
jgi:hypothetical protein